MEALLDTFPSSGENLDEICCPHERSKKMTKSTKTSSYHNGNHLNNGLTNGHDSGNSTSHSPEEVRVTSRAHKGNKAVDRGRRCKSEDRDRRRTNRDEGGKIINQRAKNYFEILLANISLLFKLHSIVRSPSLQKYFNSLEFL